MKTYRTDFVRGIVDGGRMGFDPIGVGFSWITRKYNSTVGGRGYHNGDTENSPVYRYSKKASFLLGFGANIIFAGTPQGTLIFYNIFKSLGKD